MVFGRIKHGWILFKESMKLLAKRPILTIPIFFSWIIVASIIIYMVYYFTMPAVPLAMQLLLIYFVIFLITMTTCIANIVMLEIVQQMESGQRISFGKAFREAIVEDLLKVIPLAAMWALVWLIIVIIKAMSDDDSGSSRRSPSPREIARTLGGANSGPFSWLGLGLDAFEKLVRMTFFMALPAIAWEKEGPFSAFRKSVDVIRQHVAEFLTVYTLTGIAIIFMALPLLFVFYLDDFGIVNFSDVFWMGVILYEGLAWTLMIYMEQMSVGLLYLWYLKWVRSGKKGSISSVKKPNLLDEFYELA